MCMLILRPKGFHSSLTFREIHNIMWNNELVATVLQHELILRWDFDFLLIYIYINIRNLVTVVNRRTMLLALVCLHAEKNKCSQLALVCSHAACYVSWQKCNDFYLIVRHNILRSKFVHSGTHDQLGKKREKKVVTISGLGAGRSVKYSSSWMMYMYAGLYHLQCILLGKVL